MLLIIFIVFEFFFKENLPIELNFFKFSQKKHCFESKLITQKLIHRWKNDVWGINETTLTLLVEANLEN